MDAHSLQARQSSLSLHGRDANRSFALDGAPLDTAQLPGFGRWDCLMEAQSVWLRIGRVPPGGGHRARGDAEASRQILQQLAAPVESYRTAPSPW